MEEITSKLELNLRTKFMDLWLEYEENATIESKFVKDIDRFEMLVQAHEYENNLNRPTEFNQFFSHNVDKFQTDEFKKLTNFLCELRDLKH
uniref:HD domain-containing protein 2 (Trinotate prediction) n=1 Tax=Henneguya salminicola TaxID=69463 RepID=A0A6G3MMZ8_HENSL